MQDRTQIRSLPPEDRVLSFDEVNIGYSEEEAKKEASRCLQCKIPLCEKGCPVGVPIRDFISHVKEGDTKAALARIKEKNLLPAICGRGCPQEQQCERECILARKARPIAIGNLERYCADNASVSQAPPPKNGKRVAVIGSGPAGLACAAELARNGFAVTIFEALHKPGGVLAYGIPEFRLPKSIVQKEVDFLKDIGVRFEYNSLVGSLHTIDELKEKFDAVFIGTGAGLPVFLDIPGEDSIGVYSANEFLTRVNLMKAYRFPEYQTPVRIGKHTIVIGGGNVALDAARCARRLGSQVTIMYRRTEEEMPARHEELQHAKEEGIIFNYLSAPKEIIGRPCVAGLRYIRMELGEPDASGRKRPVEVPGSESVMECDTVIVAIGQKPNPILQRTTAGLTVGRHGEIQADEKRMTSIDSVYAGGDIISGSATVIKAMADGKRAAEEMIRKFM